MDVREKMVEIVCDALESDGCIGHCNYSPCFEVERVVNALIDNGVTVQEWISVDDGLPEDQEEVLVCTRSKNGIRNIDKGYIAIDHFIHRGRAEVTHWMPLPNPPKGD